jgi:precorrin-6A/cobalt-precorrin-6A reductase
MKRILLIGGTSDTNLILEFLVKFSIEILVTVTTDYGYELLFKDKNVRINKGKLDSEKLDNLLKEFNPYLVIDSSHPYATNISNNVIKVCKANNKKYIRYERDEIKIKYNKLFLVNSYEKAANYLKEKNGNILLTIGSNNIDVFTNLIDKERLIVRILPVEKSIIKCRNLGISINNIIAIKGPFSKEFNIEILKQFKIENLVLKNSGKSGGTVEKIEACKELDINIVMIEREQIDYETVFNNLNNLFDFIESFMNHLILVNKKIIKRRF